MHKGGEIGQIIVFQTAEGIVLLNLAQGIFLERTNRNNLATTLDRVHNVAKPVLLCDSFRWNLFWLERTRSESDLIGETLRVDNLTFTLAGEEGLNLIENMVQFELRLRQERELPGVILAPEECALGEILYSTGVHANSDVVVGFNTYSKSSIHQLLLTALQLMQTCDARPNQLTSDFPPEVKTFKFHSRLQFFECVV